MNLNDLTLQIIDELDHKHIMDSLQDIDGEIKNSVNVFDKEFYFRKQDQLNHVYGELLSAYGILKKELDSWLAVRKYQMSVEYLETGLMTVDGKKISAGRAPGNDLLEGYALAEIPELHKACIGLEKWVERAQNSIRTCRSHIYGEERNSPNASSEYSK